MKLNFDKQFLNLVGEPLPEKMDDALANEMAMSTVGDPIKMHMWAVNLKNEGIIEVNEKEVKFLKDFITNRSRFVNFAKAQLLEEIEKLPLKQVESTENDNTSLEDLERDLERKVKRLP